MTVREQVLAKPGPVQIVLKASAAKMSLDRKEEPMDWEPYMAEALSWWEDLILALAPHFTEVQLAEEIIDRLRQQEVWGHILREGTN